MNAGGACSNAVVGVDLLGTNGQPTGIRLVRETHTPNARPQLDIVVLPDGRIRICWPEQPPCYQLQRSLNLGLRANWESVTSPEPEIIGGRKCLTLDIAGRTQFFRLYVPPS